MSENVDLQRQGYEAWNRGDHDTWLALADPDIELILPAVQMMEGGGALRGPEGAAHVWHALRNTFPDFRFEVEEIRDLGNRTFAKAQLRGHGAGSGAPLDQQVWHLMEWRNGKLLRFEAFLNESDALEAAGLSE